MITSLAQYIASFLLKNNAIDGKKLDIYIYGFEIIISGMVSIFIALMLGIIFSQFIECITFLVVFVFMRKCCGGYHADTYLKCNSVFAINLIIVMMILKLLLNYPLYMSLAISIFCVIIYALYAPIENKYKPIKKEARKKHKITAIILGILFSIISFVLYFKITKYSIVIDTALLSVALSMIIVKIKEGGDNNEECKEINTKSCC